MTQSAPGAGHALDRAVALQHLDGDVFAGQTSIDYANMIGPFGGVTAATILHAPMLHPARLGDPVALTLNYAGPIVDGPFEISARPVRTNRSTQHWIIELRQGEQVAVTATAVFATRRETWQATEAVFPEVGKADGQRRMQPVEWAKWTHQYDMRFLCGSPEGLQAGGAGMENSLTRLWIRDEPPRPLDFLSLAAICDAFYPRLFLRRPKMVPVGTVSLTIYFHADAAMLAGQGADAVLGSARGLNFRAGFFDQAAEVWNGEGVMLASSHQVVYYKE